MTRSRASIYLLWLTGLLLVFPSCIQRKQLVYLNGMEAAPATFQVTPPEYRVRTGDILHVKITTIDKALRDIVENQASQMERIQISEASLYISGYSVSDSGTISLPVFGQVDVAGMTITQITSKIQSSVDEMYRDAAVDVKLLSFRITILGEVSRPGTITVYQDRLSVLEAIGRVGNLTDLAKREILLLRQTDEGTKTMKLDLSSKDLITSEGFFLQPNDMIIVEPGHGKVFRLNAPIFTFSFSALSAIFLLYNFFSK